MEVKVYDPSMPKYEREEILYDVRAAMRKHENCKDIAKNIVAGYKHIAVAYRGDEVCGVMTFSPQDEGRAMYLDYMCSMCAGGGKILIDYLKSRAPEVSAYVYANLVPYYKKQGFKFTDEAERERNEWIAEQTKELRRKVTLEDEIYHVKLWSMKWTKGGGRRRTRRRKTSRK